MTNKRIVCIHLFNNYSGSPKVLMQVIEELKKRGYPVDLITNRSEGFLSNINGIQYRYLNYKWKHNKILTLFYYIFAQIQLFIIILKHYRSKNSILYINTITPIGAAIAGKLCHKKIIYHVHEKYIKTSILHRVYQSIYESSSAYSIFVSKYLQNSYPDKLSNSSVIYNSLEKRFIDITNKYLKERTVKPSTILMVCSLRGFKGIYEFVALSNLLNNYKFELVISASIAEIEKFKQENSLGTNIMIVENQTNLHPYYQRAKLLLNLSNPDEWIETFGLTILEAMAYGIPTLVPDAGGPIELVTNGYNGYLIQPKKINEVKEKIEILMEDEHLYNLLSTNALLKSKEFDNNIMKSQIIDAIEINGIFN